MIYSIIKQSLDIRLRFENPPKINADTECAAAIGMAAKLCSLPLPEKRDNLELMQQEIAAAIKGRSLPEQAEKLCQILLAYEPKSPMDEEKYELVKYGYGEEV